VDRCDLEIYTLGESLAQFPVANGKASILEDENCRRIAQIGWEMEVGQNFPRSRRTNAGVGGDSDRSQSHLSWKLRSRLQFPAAGLCPDV